MTSGRRTASRNHPVPRTGDPAPRSALGERLRALRVLYPLTRAELAARSGIAERQIANIELGATSRPVPSTLRALATVLGVSAAELAPLAYRSLPEDSLPLLRVFEDLTPAEQFVVLSKYVLGLPDAVTAARARITEEEVVAIAERVKGRLSDGALASLAALLALPSTEEITTWRVALMRTRGIQIVASAAIVCGLAWPAATCVAAKNPTNTTQRAVDDERPRVHADVRDGDLSVPFAASAATGGVGGAEAGSRVSKIPPGSSNELRSDAIVPSVAAEELRDRFAWIERSDLFINADGIPERRASEIKLGGPSSHGSEHIAPRVVHSYSESGVECIFDLDGQFIRCEVPAIDLRMRWLGWIDDAGCSIHRNGHVFQLFAMSYLGDAFFVRWLESGGSCSTVGNLWVVFYSEIEEVAFEGALREQSGQFQLLRDPAWPDGVDGALPFTIRLAHAR